MSNNSLPTNPECGGDPSTLSPDIHALAKSVRQEASRYSPAQRELLEASFLKRLGYKKS